jgi:hypothetical protein
MVRAVSAMARRSSQTSSKRWFLASVAELAGMPGVESEGINSAAMAVTRAKSMMAILPTGKAARLGRRSG